MPNLLADVNAEGHVRALIQILDGANWGEVWQSLAVTSETFASQSMDQRLPDMVVWQLCQDRDLVLVTANRNDESDDSLEAAIRLHNRSDSLPIITIADADRLLRDSDYANRAADRLIEYIVDLKRYRGTGRLYIP